MGHNFNPYLLSFLRFYKNFSPSILCHLSNTVCQELNTWLRVLIHPFKPFLIWVVISFDFLAESFLLIGEEEGEVQEMVHGAAHFLFGIFGNINGLLLFLAPTITFKRIIVNKSTEQFSGIPYAMTLLNCLLSAWYGLPFVSKNNMLVSTINGIGAAIESTYVLIFLIYAPKKEKAKFLALCTIVLSVFSAVAFISLFALHGNTRRLFCGFSACIFSIIMYASPLSVMRTVIKTKSVEYMPFFLSMFVFFCGMSWFIYGLLGNDLFVSVPNGFGSVLGALQLMLYVIYYDKKGETKTANTDGSLEMGLEKHTDTQPSENGHV